MLIGVSGKMGSGKTLLAKVAEEHFGFKRIAFGDNVKHEVITYLEDREIYHNPTNFFGTQVQKNETIFIPNTAIIPEMKEKSFCNLCTDITSVGFILTYRSLMQWWGTEYRRKQDSNYWLESLFDSLDQSIPTIIDDVRMLNEAHLIRVAGGLLIRVNWEGALNLNTHSSETTLDTYPFFNLTIHKPAHFTKETAESEYSAILSNIIGDIHESTARETASTLSG